MPRFPRSFCQTQFFHIMVQGINKAYIFNEPTDIKYYIKILYSTMKECEIEIKAYCIMNNHAHMLLKAMQIKNLSNFMHRVNTKYAMYYNKKYDRVGYVFRNRYKSEGILDDDYYENCIRYIYYNPVKAGICSKPEDYKFSNCKQSNYICTGDSQYKFMDVDDDDEIQWKKAIDSFLENNKINIEMLKNNNRYLQMAIAILKEQYDFSLRKIAKELNISREKIRKLYSA